MLTVPRVLARGIPTVEIAGIVLQRVVAKRRRFKFDVSLLAPERQSTHVGPAADWESQVYRGKPPTGVDPCTRGGRGRRTPSEGPESRGQTYPGRISDPRCSCSQRVNSCVRVMRISKRSIFDVLKMGTAGRTLRGVHASAPHRGQARAEVCHRTRVGQWAAPSPVTRARLWEPRRRLGGMRWLRSPLSVYGSPWGRAGACRSHTCRTRLPADEWGSSA